MSLVLSLLMACTPDNELSRRSTTDVFSQEPLSEVDILWVIDDSGSMAEEQLLVADGFEAFISTLAETNIDFHVGVVSTDMDLSNPNRGVLIGTPGVLTADTPNYVNKFASRVQVGVEGSDKEKGLSASIAALSEPLISGANEGFLRPDAHLSVIYVSDEERKTSIADEIFAWDRTVSYTLPPILIQIDRHSARSICYLRLVLLLNLNVVCPTL